MKNSISATYNGEKILVETNDNSINLTRGQAYNLIKLLQDIDNKYNLKGRIIKEEEWDRIDCIIKKCLELEVGRNFYLKVEDEDLKFAFIDKCTEKGMLHVASRGNIIIVTRIPF